MISKNDIKNIDVPKSKDDWYTIEKETVVYNRNIEIVEKFEKEWDITLDGNDDEKCEMFFKIVSRNSVIQNWYSSQKLIFSETNEIPKYLKENLSLEEYSITKDNLTRNKDLNIKVAKDIQKLSTDYQTKIKELQASVKNFEIKNNDRFFEVLNLSVNDLPLELTIKILNYVPAENGDITSQKVYGRELLIQYKIFLIKKLKENENTKLSDIINLNKPLS